MDTTKDMSHEASKPAPEPLSLIQRFVNSLDLDHSDEELSSPESLRDWLAERVSSAPTSASARATCAGPSTSAKACGRSLLANNGEELDEPAVERLERAASRAGVRELRGRRRA